MKLSMRGRFWVAYVAVVLASCLAAFAAEAAETAGTWTVTSGSDSVGYTLASAVLACGGGVTATCVLAPASFCSVYVDHMVSNYGATVDACSVSTTEPVTASTSGTSAGGAPFSYVWACADCALDDEDEPEELTQAQAVAALAWGFLIVCFGVGFIGGRQR